METYIARQPILNQDKKLEAYEIIYNQDGYTLHSQTDARVANAIVALFTGVDSRAFLNNMDCFLTFTPNLLQQNIPHIFDEKKVVIQIEDNVLINPAAMRALEKYKHMGFRVAFAGFDFNRRTLDALSLIDILKIDMAAVTEQSLEQLCALARQFDKKLFGFNICDERTEKLAVQYQLDYLQGSYIGKTEKSQVQSLEHMQLVFLRLLIAITKPEPDVDEIAQLISMDASLSYSLLKMVNSAYFSLSKRIQDVKQALLIIGLGQIKQWIYLLSFTPDGGNTDELIKTSFQRAVFCQNIAVQVPGVVKADAYLAGMFSTLGELLGISLEDAVRDLPIDDELKQGLQGEDNVYGRLISLCVHYESGEWNKMNENAEKLALDEASICKCYLDAVKYVSDTLNALLNPGSN